MQHAHSRLGKLLNVDAALAPHIIRAMKDNPHDYVDADTWSAFLAGALSASEVLAAAFARCESELWG